MAEKTKFASMYNRTETIEAPTGTEFDKTYTMFIDENGHKNLKCTGETNRYAKIQTYKEECLIENILARATLDPSVLNARKGLFFDATSLQKMTLAEAQNAILAINQEFTQLSAEERAKFDNSIEKYVAEYGSKVWAEKMGRIPTKVEEPTQEGEENNAE